MYSTPKYDPSSPDSYGYMDGPSLIDHPTPPESAQPSTHSSMQVQCSKFAGLGHENPARFLEEFNSYVTLHNIQSNTDGRKVAAFHLHLKGPAKVWFNTLGLSPVTRKSWVFVQKAFSDRFVMLDPHTNPQLLAERQLFSTMKMAPSQALIEFHSLLVEKAMILGKSPQDVLLRFIEGLPPSLALFVRAGNPMSHEQALNAAQMGEAYGYREQLPGAQSKPIPSVNAVAGLTHTTTSDVSAQISSLKDMVSSLSLEVQAMKSANQPGTYTRKRNDDGCRKCQGEGHWKRDCNLTLRSGNRPELKCSICMQNGHTDRFCRQARAQDSYGQARAQDSYGQARAQDSYGQTRAQDSYGQARAQDSHGQARAQDSYGQANSHNQGKE